MLNRGASPNARRSHIQTRRPGCRVQVVLHHAFGLQRLQAPDVQLGGRPHPGVDGHRRSAALLRGGGLGSAPGITIFPEEFGIKLLTLPVGGFLTLGALIALMQWALAKSEKKKEAK